MAPRAARRIRGADARSGLEMPQTLTIEPVARICCAPCASMCMSGCAGRSSRAASAMAKRLNERHLAEMLGVSTTPVKDAIRKLESEGLVRTEARRGVFVEFSPRQALEMALGRAALESVMTHIAANASARPISRRSRG